MRRHFSEAFAVARRLTPTLEDAEDACQEAFARAYFRLSDCSQPSLFRGWLMQIVRHHAHNVRRYQTLRAAESVGDDLASPVGDTAERIELRARLRAALKSLPPVKRAVVKHYDIDGWSHLQISQALGISVAMSRRHLSDARALLRTQLGAVASDYFSGGTIDE